MLITTDYRMHTLCPILTTSLLISSFGSGVVVAGPLPGTRVQPATGLFHVVEVYESGLQWQRRILGAIPPVIECR